MTPSDVSDDSLAPACEAFLLQLSHFGVLSADFYLLLGQPRPSRELPAHLTRGEPRQCYKNAGVLATHRPELAYCEGYALRAGLIPVHHAWCLDPDGVVIDPTWPHDPANEYWGVSLSTEFLLLTLSASKVWGVLAERLPAEILQRHPDDYLHPEWRPEASRLDLFWNKLQARLRPVAAGQT